MAKERKPTIAQLALLPTALGNANIEYPSCVKCALHASCVHPFIVPFVPKGWREGRRILAIGEAPGKDEDEQQRPFVGRSGQLLRELYREAGLDDVDMAFHNACRCRPPSNATPSMQQVRLCRGFVLEVLLRLQPRAVLAIGGTALKSLSNDGQASIQAYRGRPINVPGLQDAYSASQQMGPDVLLELPAVFVTYHPSAVLRGGAQYRAEIMHDFRRLLVPPLAVPANALPSGSMLGFDTEFAPDGTLLTVAIADEHNAFAEDLE